MLWRTPYKTISLTQAPGPIPRGVSISGNPWCPEGLSCIALALNESGIKNVEIWKKLFLSEPDLVAWTGYVKTGFSPKVWEQIPDTIPHSQGKQVVLLDSLPATYLTWIVESKVVAFVLLDREVIHGVSGPPTEDAWEEFANFGRKPDSR